LSKGEAPDAFTVRLARQPATQGIRINTVAPGSAHTDIHATAGKPIRPTRVVSRILMACLGEPKTWPKPAFGSSATPPPTRPARFFVCRVGFDRAE